MEAWSHARLQVDGDVSRVHYAAAAAAAAWSACFAGRLSMLKEAPQPGVCVTSTYSTKPPAHARDRTPPTPVL
jgi:hypothetical protein